mmetsp:Transcript_5955/g.12682  ORF Transcript_5955/g.12682 Transcript_5955/m.12682 type:complete len:281 (-) Transcript_5955:2222-3064(-)
MHLLRIRSVRIHPRLLRPGVHFLQSRGIHLRPPAHEVDSLEDPHASPLQALELDGLVVLPRGRISFHVHDVIGEFDAEAALAQDAGGVGGVHPSEEEVVGAVGDGGFVPGEFGGGGGGALDAKVVDPSGAVGGQLDVQGGVVDLLELRPVVEFLFVPEPLILLEVEVVHAGLPHLLVGGTSFDDLPFVGIVELQVVVAGPELSVDAPPDVGQEGAEEGHVEGAGYLFGFGEEGQNRHVSQEKGGRDEVSDAGPWAAMEHVADPQDGLQEGVSDGEEDPEV